MSPASDAELTGPCCAIPPRPPKPPVPGEKPDS